MGFKEQIPYDSHPIWQASNVEEFAARWMDVQRDFFPDSADVYFQILRDIRLGPDGSGPLFLIEAVQPTEEGEEETVSGYFYSSGVSKKNGLMVVIQAGEKQVAVRVDQVRDFKKRSLDIQDLPAQQTKSLSPPAAATLGT